MTVSLRIDGTRITDIASFYDEVNRVFMADEPWTLGPSLDALDDLLYGGYGALHGASSARVEWTDHERSRRALGRDATIAYYAAKLENSAFDSARARHAIAELEAGGGADLLRHRARDLRRPPRDRSRPGLRSGARRPAAQLRRCEAPLRSRIVPDAHCASAEARYRIAAATSSGVATRPKGLCSRIASPAAPDNRVA